MAVRYIQIPEKRMTVALLENTRYDVVTKISKILDHTKSLCFDPTKYVINNTFRAVAVCSEDDEWNEEVGRAVAKDKVLRKYYKAYDKKLDDFVDDLNEAMFSAVSRL